MQSAPDSAPEYPALSASSPLLQSPTPVPYSGPLPTGPQCRRLQTWHRRAPAVFQTLLLSRVSIWPYSHAIRSSYALLRALARRWFRKRVATLLRSSSPILSTPGLHAGPLL
eukprot:1179653-Prorocentrum_minimum.AAC.2